MFASSPAPRPRRWLLGIGLIAATLLSDLDGLSTRLQYPRQHIVARANSPYGKLIVTESDGQFDFLENGIPITSTRDDQHVEETVHYAMAQRPEARRVLLVSGGISGTAREILKYGVRAVDYVELDPADPGAGQALSAGEPGRRANPGHQHGWAAVREADPGEIRCGHH